MSEHEAMGEHNLPWVYRPLEHDDWGWIRDSAGFLAACAWAGEEFTKTHDEHRRDGTDPYGKYAAFIVDAVNNHARLTRENEALTKVLQATQGRVMNANIDLGSGHTKARVSRTMQGIIEFVDGALASLKEPAR